MKKLLLIIALVFTTSAIAQKQVSMHMYVKVLPEHQEEFERLEIDYWSKVAKKEIDAGRMTGWGLMKSIGVDKAATEANYLIVNTFENIKSELLKIPSSLFFDLDVRVVSKSLFVIDEFILTKTGSFSFHSPLDNTKCI